MDQLREPTDKWARILQDIEADGFSIFPGFLDIGETAVLASEAAAHRDNGEFHAAGVGRGTRKARHAEIRSDHVRWIERDDATPATARYLDWVEELRSALNRSFFLSLVEFECHFAVFPAGAFYKPHLDRFRDDGRRMVTVILYLNTDWKAGDGGLLRLYHGTEESDPSTDVEPQGGTLVAFDSARFLHEVLPARRERVSLTGWLCRRGAGVV